MGASLRASDGTTTSAALPRGQPSVWSLAASRFPFFFSYFLFHFPEKMEETSQTEESRTLRQFQLKAVDVDGND